MMIDRPLIVGVMGGGRVDRPAYDDAYRLGRLIAARGWVLLNGGRNAGIMAAAAKGACEGNGLTVGILPDEDPSNASPHIRIPICTGMGSARNMINVLSSDIVVACPGGAGTVSEIALALKHGKTVIALNHDTGDLFSSYLAEEKLLYARTPEETIRLIADRFHPKGLV